MAFYEDNVDVRRRPNAQPPASGEDGLEALELAMPNARSKHRVEHDQGPADGARAGKFLSDFNKIETVRWSITTPASSIMSKSAQASWKQLAHTATFMR